ncbi:hypothetical protein GQ457_07G004610 [Hibiscus cannabinus]
MKDTVVTRVTGSEMTSVVSGYFGCESDVKSSYNVELLFAASFDSKMGSLCSLFDVKKQGKPIREVRKRYWKLWEGENRLLGLLEGISIASLGKARRQGGSSITFVQVRFLWLCPEFCISGLEYRYPISGIGTEFQHWNLGIGTARRFDLVSILWNAYRYPSPFMELGYRYWLLSTDIGCLKTTYGVLRSMILYVLVPELSVYDFMSLNDPFDSKLHT